MQLDAILEVAIGLVFAWMVLSLGVMQVQEWISKLFQWRANSLEQAILDMFRGEKKLVDQFYDHPFIKELCKLDKEGKIVKKPDFIPNDVFGKVGFEILMSAGKSEQEAPPPEAMSFGVMSAGVDEAKASVNPELARTMDRLFPGMGKPTEIGAVSFGLGETIQDIGQKANEYRKNVENWFDKVMNQSSSWYKENAQKWALIIGVVLAFLLNIDSVNIMTTLWREPTVRQALVEQVSATQPDTNTPTVGEIPDYFAALTLPVGWTTIPTDEPGACNSFVNSEGRFAIRSGNDCRLLVNVPKSNDFWGWVVKVLGLLISGAAAMQGAPFWFDLLKKLIGLRPGQKREEMPKPVG